MRKYDLILWDYNGTLVDDVQAALSSVNDMLVKRDMPTIDLDDYYSYIDVPIIKFYEHIFDLNEVPFSVIAEEFSAGYERYIQQNPLMTGAIEALDLAQVKGIKQTILSASHKDSVNSMLERLEISNYFFAVSAADNRDAANKAGRGKELLDFLGVSPSRALMVGDTLHDFSVAQEIGADCILTLNGHQGKEQLRFAGVPLIENLNEIVSYI